MSHLPRHYSERRKLLFSTCRNFAVSWPVILLVTSFGCSSSDQTSDQSIPPSKPSGSVPETGTQDSFSSEDIASSGGEGVPPSRSKSEPGRTGTILTEPTNPAVHTETAIRLIDVTKTSGIDFLHTDGGSGKGYIVEGMASGIITFDYNDDGLVDIYFLNGAPLEGMQTDVDYRNRIYRNNGDWTFTDVTEESGLGDRGFALGGTVGDYDADGRLDLFVNNFGKNVLYHNEGDGVFRDVTEQAGLGTNAKVGAGAAFFDKDGDGDLDLYVANYVDFTYENYVPIKLKEVMFQAGPQYYQPVSDSLYENDGTGRFVDVSEESGVGKYAGPGMAVMAWDYDRDGDIDVFVCNDGKPNYLLQNDGSGQFTDVAVVVGVAYDFGGKANSSMGVDLGDYNLDGLLDLFVTDYQSELPVLYRGLPGGFFEDATTSARIDGDLFAHVHWGTSFADFDNDGHLDLFIACGHFDPIELIDDRTAKKVRNYLLRNQGNGTFVDVSTGAGNGMQIVESSRGIAVEDFDNDGDLDVVIVNSAAPPTLLRNDSVVDHHWLQVVPIGKSNGKISLGSEVKVIQPNSSRLAVALGARGYQSYFGNVIHFGLGPDTEIQSVEVRWPGGETERFKVSDVDQRIELLEGTGEKL